MRFLRTPVREGQMTAGSAIGIGSPAIAAYQEGESPKKKQIDATKAIHQEEDYNAAPQRIYEALLGLGTPLRFRRPRSPDSP